MALGRHEPRVVGWRSLAWEKQGEPTTQDVGRGRGAGHRETRVLQHTRSHLTPIAPQADTSAALRQRCGWQALVTKAGPQRLAWPEAVWCSRTASRVARLFHRRKSRRHSAPLCVKRTEHREGLTSLLTRGGRVLTVMEVVRRRSLQNAQVPLPSGHPENKHKRTDTPTAARSLTAFAAIALTIIKHVAGEDMLRRLTPLSGVQEDRLQRLGCGALLYGQLAMQTIGI